MSLPNISNVSRPRANGYGCRIDNTYYRLFVTPDSPMRRENADLQAQRIDDQSTPESISQDFGVSFTRGDFSGGEGLRLAHLPNNPEMAFSMFWDSLGIDTHTRNQEQRSALRLLKNIERIDELLTSNIHLAYDSNGERLYVSSGTNIRFTDTPNAVTPSFSQESPHAGQGAEDVEDIAFFGGELFVALGTSGLHKRDSGGTYTDITDTADPEWVSTNTTGVWNVKQRVLFANNNQLWEVIDTVTGDSALRLTIESGFTFNDTYDSGSSILVSATDGYIYSLSLDEETSALQVSGRFSIAGEVPAAVTGLDALTLLTTYQLTPNGGYIGRVWLLSVQDGTLANRQIIKEFGDNDTSHDYRILASNTQRDRAFLGVNEELRTHLWHYDYATTGIFRHMGGDVFTGQIVDIVNVGTRTFWSVAGHGVIRESTDNNPFGYVITPLADNFTRDQKSWSGVIVDVESIGGPSQVKIYYSTNVDAIYSPDHPSWREWVTVSNVEHSGQVFFLSGTSSRYITLKIELYGDQNDSPHFNSVTVLSSPGQSDIVYELPINVSDVITKPRHAPKTVPGLGRKIHNELKAVQGHSITLEVLDPAETIQGTVMNISEPIIFFPLRGSPIFVAQVTVRGRRVPKSGAISISESDASFGIGLLGVMFTGGLEG